MIIPRFAFWDPGTWSIPKLYWDSFSQEQRIHAICKQLGKVIAYADYLGVNVDDIAERLKAIEDGQLDQFIVDAIEQWFEDNQPAIISALDALNDALPIGDFDSVNTVKAALDAIDNDVSALENRFPVDTADIADDAVTNAKLADNAVTSAKILNGTILREDLSPEIIKEINSIRESNSPSATINPIYVGDILGISSAQGIAVNGDDLYVSFRDGTNATPNIKRISLDTKTILKTYNNVSIGHGNSLAWDTVRNLLWIAEGDMYTIDQTLTNWAAYPDQPLANTTCVAFDNVTKTLWVMAGLSADLTQTLYKMEQDETTFTEFAVIDNVPSRQDITVNNDVLYINSTRGSCSIFVINRDSPSVEFIDSIEMGHKDASGRWDLIEPEGMCIDSDNRFWIVYSNQSEYNKADGSSVFDGIVCNIPHGGKLFPAVITTVHNHRILYMNSTTQNKFTMGITELKSLCQLQWVDSSNANEIQIQSNFTDPYPGWIPKGSIFFEINSSVTLKLDEPMHYLGGVFLFRNQGTLEVDGSFIVATNTPLIFIMKNTGTITLNGTSRLVNFGTVPCVGLFDAVGTLSGAYSFGSTAITTTKSYIIGDHTGTY